MWLEEPSVGSFEADGERGVLTIDNLRVRWRSRDSIFDTPDSQHGYLEFLRSGASLQDEDDHLSGKQAEDSCAGLQQEQWGIANGEARNLAMAVNCQRAACKEFAPVPFLCASANSFWGDS